MRIINLGILAHVDAGKTTITENFLYKSGVITTLGRVDKGNTVTDSMSIEKERGITIRTSTISFNWENTKINILDTPGHIDFIAEVERSMQALDGAILVISAKEGVQVQTRVIFNTLQELKIPTIIFINKIDRIGVNLSNIYSQIKEQLSEKVIVLQLVDGEGTHDLKIRNYTEDSLTFQKVQESMCEFDEQLMSSYLDGEITSEKELENIIVKHASNGEVYPIFHGAALHGIGVDELLYGIVKYLPGSLQDCCNQNLSAVVYKIDRDEHLQKKIYFRVFQGKLAVRDTVKIFNKGVEIKIKKLESINQGKVDAVNEIAAGDIGIISNANDLSIGDVIGIPSDIKRKTFMTVPTLETTILPGDSANRIKLIEALHIIMEEEPLLNCRIDANTHEIIIQLFGEIQKEVIKSMIRERFKIDVEFTKTKTLYKKRPRHSAKAVINIGESRNPFNASIALSVEPAPITSGLIYEDQVSYGYLTKPFHNAVFEGIKNALVQGIFDKEITDIKVCFTNAFYDSVKSTPSDFRNLAPLVLMEAILKAGTELLQPMMKYELIIPQEVSAKAIGDLKQMSATLSEFHIRGNEMIICGKIPVETSKSYSVSLASYTGGRGVFNCRFCSYEVFNGETENKIISEENNMNKYLLQKSNAIRG